MSSLSTVEMAELRGAFTLLAQGKDHLSASDLTLVLKELHYESTAAAARTTLSSSTNRRSSLSNLLQTLSLLAPDKSLSFSEFVALAVHPDPNDVRDEVRRVFDLFDKDGKGFINVNDLRTVAHDLGEQMTEDELQQMIDRTAKKGGKVTYTEFASMMNKKLFSS
jgi:Ca2+-binding EF-hand superfamily protein